MSIISELEKTHILLGDKQAKMQALRLAQSSDPEFEQTRSQFLQSENTLNGAVADLVEALEDCDPLDREDLIEALNPDLKATITMVLNNAGRRDLLVPRELTLESLLTVWRQARNLMLLYQFMMEVTPAQIEKDESYKDHPMASRSQEDFETALANLKEQSAVCDPDDQICHITVTTELLEQARKRYQRLTIRLQNYLKELTQDGKDPWPVIRTLPQELVQCAWDALKMVPLKEEEAARIVSTKQVGNW